MTPVIPCSSGSVTLLTKATFSQRRDIKLTKYKVSPRSSRALFSNQRFLLPHSVSLRLLQKQLSDCSSKYVYRAQFLAAIGTDVATEEPNPAISAEQVDTSPESLPSSTETETDESSAVSSTTPAAQSKRTRPARRSDMPPVKNEELLPGASFTGKVRSIQPFGAFVDFGAFTDGLVHVSKLSDEFVKDVGNVVSVGEEVKVRIVEANIETGRISLTMRDTDDVSKLQQRREASSGGSDRPRTGRKNAGRSTQRRDEAQRTSKFLKGQVLDGTVKNLTRSGAYVSLPDGEEGFLPLSEESEFGNLLGSSTLQVGQEVNVRVLRISRGQATLSMKKEEEVEAINMKLNQGVVHAATNPFVLAFRQNKDIAAFLDEREKAQESAEDLSEEEVDEKLPNESNQLELQNSATTSDSEVITIPTSVNKPEENIVLDSGSSETVIDDGGSEILTSEENASIDAAIPEASQQTEIEKPDFSTQLAKDDQDDDMSSGSLISQETDSSSDSFAPEASVAIEVEEADTPADTVLDDDSASSLTNLTLDATSETNIENEIGPATEIAHEVEASDGSLTSEGISAADSVADATLTADNSVEIISGVGASVEDVVSEEAVTSQADSSLVDENVENEAPADVIVSESPDMGVTDDAASNVQSAPVQENSATASISPALVKRLREETGAGMMDCKKALAETGGDIDKAQEFLRKKGLAGADKKASRATAEGRIGSYIHDNRIGVLIEVNCETDFVSRGDIFKELVDDLAMQVAACPQVQYLVTEDVPEEIVTKERELEVQKEDLLTKPEQIRSKIVDGRIRKRLEELALLEQSYIKNDKMVVKDFVKQTIATIGENIKVKRFVRYNLGEGLQKKSQDFAAEVAAQTAAKEPPAVPKDQPSESEEPIEKPPVVAVSAALVKELREETGAGMMDCKKALTESGGDLEKAQEYLRKKGLSSADKKSSRLAAEGRIATYIHDNRIGVLIEVNSETDFVARNERFKQLVNDLAMQVVACPQVEFVSMEEIPESVLSKEKEIEMQREDLQSKPENIREKIVEGRVSKRLGELALLEKPFIKDDSLLVKDLVKQTVAALGENIRVRRFVRFTLGE